MRRSWFIPMVVLLTMACGTGGVEEPPAVDEVPDVAEAPTAKEEPDVAEVPDVDVPEGMVLVPGGCFTMGSEGGDADEQPVHEVCLEPFFLDTHEVTNEELLPL